MIGYFEQMLAVIQTMQRGGGGGGGGDGYHQKDPMNKIHGYFMQKLYFSLYNKWR